jgi:hypothetical protein
MIEADGGCDMGFDLSVLGSAVALAGVLILMMRWVFSSPRRGTGRPDHGPDADLGLLIPILQGASRARALQAKNQLSEQGIRCSLSRLERDRYDVLVFRPDAEQAAIVLKR